MSRTYRIYLEDLLRAARAIEHYLTGIDFARFSSEEQIYADAVLYNLIVIGEAAKHVPEAIRAKYPAIRWQSIAGLRDVLAHEYFRINLEVVWNIARQHLPELVPQIVEILEYEPLD